MNLLVSKRQFQPKSSDAAGRVSWVHFGDLHMTKGGEQNHLDLAQIVNEVNRAFSDSVSFVSQSASPLMKDGGAKPKFSTTYEEDLKVGYKWYDAEKKRVLFGFG